MFDVQLLASYAAAAQIHSEERHGFHRSIQVEDVDVILDRERDLGQANDQAALVACYGAWFGTYIASIYQAEWVGMAEPTPPRISIAHRLYSPFDAVEQRLLSADAHRLSQLFFRLQGEHPLADAMSQSSHRESALAFNARAWDQLADQSRFTNSQWFSLTRESAIAALDPWLRQDGVAGKRILALAAAGGTHAPLLAMAGATVTLVDISPRMLAIDEQFNRQLAADSLTRASTTPIRLVCESLDALDCLESASFDIVLQPVSMNYLTDPMSVYGHVARLLVPKGLYLVQHKNPLSLQCSFNRADGGWYRVEHPQWKGTCISAAEESQEELGLIGSREHSTREFPHALDELIGGLCRSGFSIEDFTEPPRADGWATDGASYHQAIYIPPYFKIKARRMPPPFMNGPTGLKCSQQF
jgi:SAM-dependent methyltransferase